MRMEMTAEEQAQIDQYKAEIAQWDWAAIRAKVTDEEAMEIGMPQQICLGLQREMLPSGDPTSSIPGLLAHEPREDTLWWAALCQVAGETITVLAMPGDVHASGEPTIWLEWSGKAPL